MKSVRRKIVGSMIGVGVLFGGTGACLPEDYFARTARALSVAVADALLSSALTPVFEAIGAEDALGGGGDTDADAADGTP